MEIVPPTSPDPSGSGAVEDDTIAEPRSSSIRVSARRRHVEGDVLAGRYQILGLLGEGGMGTVWRAHCRSLDVDVAVKVLHYEHSDVHAAARLLREARATASLGHPAIVRTLDFGETDDGGPFLVMELLDGASLASWIDERGRMTAARAVQVLLPIADALSAAHAHGIVHRDIKPDNIILVPDGPGTYRPKIFDFGIAKWAPPHDGHVLTDAGTILGSLEYMSPEQADCKEVGEQTDVWGLCVVLYELIAGRRPFDAPTLTAMIFALYSCTPTPTTHFAAGDEDLWRIIERGLMKSPADRWPSMRALGCALASWAAQRGIDADACGTSLAHHWLATTSEAPPASSRGAGSIPLAPTSVLPLSSPPEGTTSARTAPTARRAAVTGSAYTTTVEPPRRPRVTALLLGAYVFVLGLMVVVVALGAHGGGATVGARPVEPWSADQGRTVAPQVVTSIPVAVDPLPAPSAVTIENVAPPPTPSHRTAPNVRPKRVPATMPFPAAPNF
jgi:eukaryotic-like serine/threonine-protein kinase